VSPVTHTQMLAPIQFGQVSPLHSILLTSMKRLKYLYLLLILSSCNATRPKIECFDPNSFAADTSYFVRGHKYRGFIFTKNYTPLLTVTRTRFTPTSTDIEIAEKILGSKVKYGRAYSRQYIGHINSSGDSLVYVRLLKKGLKEECFDKIVAVGFGERYEKDQRMHDINLTKKVVE